MNYELFEHKSTVWAKEKTKKIFLINMSQEHNPYFSEWVQTGIAKYLKNWKKIAILVNKKGYATGVLCQKCWYVPKCKNCSVSISYHQLKSWDFMWLCHICKTQYNLPTTCPECHSNQIKDFGLGMQKVAEYIEENFKTKPLLIDSSKARSHNKITKLKEAFNTTQIFIWTSLLTTPPQDLVIDLVVFLQADLWLNIPDYSANENNFNFLHDAFTKYDNATFLVQSFNPDHYSIRSACKLDPRWFQEQENIFRKEHNYPPFWDLCVLLYKNEIEESLFKKVDTLHKELLYLRQKYQLDKDIEIYSTPPLVYKMYGKYRYHIVIKWAQVRNFMDIVYTKLNLQKRGFKVDWEAQSII